MPPSARILIGLAAALLAAWLSHGPLGRGEALVVALEGQAKAEVAKAELAGVEVKLGRHPLSRNATLSGPANDIQREGLGGAKGINDYVREVDGIGGLAWADSPHAARGAMPLLAETMLFAALAYLVGLALGWLAWGRRRRSGFA